MKAIKITYWVTTAITAAMMLMSGVMYQTSSEIIGTFRKMGFPDFFRVELGLAKILAALVLLIPFKGYRLKEWAYFGLFVVFVSATILHVSIGDPMGKVLAPVIFLLLLLTSYFTYNKLNQQKINHP